MNLEQIRCPGIFKTVLPFEIGGAWFFHAFFSGSVGIMRAVKYLILGFGFVYAASQGGVEVSNGQTPILHLRLREWFN